MFPEGTSAWNSQEGLSVSTRPVRSHRREQMDGSNLNQAGLIMKDFLDGERLHFERPARGLGVGVGESWFTYWCYYLYRERERQVDLCFLQLLAV